MLRYQAIDLRDIADVYAIRLAATLGVPSPDSVDKRVLKDVLSLACSIAIFNRGSSQLFNFIGLKDDRVIDPDDLSDYIDQDDTLAEQIEQIEEDISKMIEVRVSSILGDLQDPVVKIFRSSVKPDFTLVISYTDFDEEDVSNIKQIMEESSIEKDLKAFYSESP